MKARDILQQYQEGRREFQGVSLRGLSFKRKDLSGADFSGADIRGTNFRGAILRGTNFQGAKAGLQKHWVMILLVDVFVLGWIAGIFNVLSGGIVAAVFDNSFIGQLIGWSSLILVIVFWIVFICQGIVSGIGTLIILLALAFRGMTAGAIAFVGAFILAVAIVFAFAVKGNVGLAIVFTGVVSLIIFEVVTGGENILAGSRLIVQSLIVVTVSILLSAYIAYRAIKDDQRQALIRNIAIGFASTGGTCFREADLTDADFSNATLKSTDFREANLIRTCWRDAKKLEWVRPGKTYLQEVKVRELVKTGQGENQNFNRLDLQGVNLEGANLVNASFIEVNLNSANLQDADLSRAKLVGTFLDQTDLTGATLTGAFIEDWGITAETKLHGIRCDYIFMRLPPDKRPDFLQLPPEESLKDNPRRKPDDWEKNFEDGEFVDFITPMVETLDLYHNQTADPRIVAYSFQKLQEDHPEAELEIVSMERRGKNRQGFLMRVETAPQADNSELHGEYFDTKNRLEALPPEQVQLLLAEKDKRLADQGEQIKNLIGFVGLAMQRPNIYAENYNHQGDTKMSESSGDKIDIGENYGVAGKEGKFENYGVAGKQEEIKNAKFARTIYEAQQKTLAEIAAEIQQLLQQLEKSNSTETTAGQMAVVSQAIEIVENNPTLKQRVIGALKSGGTEAFKEALDHPVANVLVAAFEGWSQP